jgi:tRNA pseudouridine55 synthase
MQGLLLVDKPSEWTSFDIVNYIRRIVATAENKKPKNCKVGHAGTLDPFATGLLVLMVGKEYTRRAGELTKLDKTYEVTARLGETSTTGDPEGSILKISALVPTKTELEAVLIKFMGTTSQIPPAFSAIKVNGQRAYKLAREGKEVVIEARPITIKRLDIIDYNYPDLKFVTDVTSGTYIRTLVADIGKQLSTGAYTTALRRTKVATYSVEDAIKVDNLSPVGLEAALRSLE